MCTYCGCESIEPIGRFMAEHVDIINLTGPLRAACEAGDDALVREHAAAVAAALDPHVAAEEVGLFSVMRRQGDFADHIAVLCAEHGSLDELLAAIVAGQHELFDEFEHALREHINKEDNGLFPAAAIALDGLDWEEVQALETSSREANHRTD